MLPDKLAFVDVETTGGSPTQNKIIEIGILRVENNKVVKTYETLLNPQQPVPPFISSMTGIASTDLEEAPTFRDVMQEIYELLEGCTFVAHNVKFDYSFVRSEFRRQDYGFSSPLMCTAQLSRKLFPEHTRHNLDVIMERFNLSCAKRHRAFDDAKIMWDFYQTLTRDYAHERLHDVITTIMKGPSIPPQLSHDLFDTLPEQPGVYIFYGEQETPLYIGKSKNIRERVCAHFSNDFQKSIQMEIQSQIRDIQFIETVGNLGALLLESQLIKKNQPLLNKRLRQWKKATVLMERMQPGGYKTIEIVETDTITKDMLPSLIHVSKSKKSAKEMLTHLGDEYSLCPKLLGLEKTSSSCFQQKIGRCKGACIGKEQPVLYNMRFSNAFSKKRIPRWPFSGPIMISERDPFEQRMDAHVFDDWCYLGTATSEQELHDEVLPSERLFDYDLYMILKNHLKSEKSYAGLKVLAG
jgi:DNA polymerase-3 subunit epsilon